MSKNLHMQFRLFKLEKIPKNIKNKLIATLTDEDDPLLEWLRIQMPDVHVCILVQNEEIVSWACFSFGPDITPRLFAWTKEEYREQGFAKKTIAELMSQEGWRVQDRPLTAYSDATRHILTRLGFNCDWTNC